MGYEEYLVEALNRRGRETVRRGLVLDRYELLEGMGPQGGPMIRVYYTLNGETGYSDEEDQGEVDGQAVGNPRPGTPAYDAYIDARVEIFDYIVLTPLVNALVDPEEYRSQGYEVPAVPRHSNLTPASRG
jgi:hypothetical protein